MCKTTANLTSVISEIITQKEYEASYSLTGFREVVKEEIVELDFASLEAKWAEYQEAVKASGIEHSGYHVALMEQAGIKWGRVFSTMIETICFNHSYLEHRVLGYKIGQKICPKKVVVDGKTLVSSPSTKLSLGANVVQFLKNTGYLRARIVKSAKKHTHNIVEPTDKFREFMREAGLYVAASRVRSGSCGYKIQPHSEESPGGLYLDARTMLRDPSIVQSSSVCVALNKLQGVRYNLIAEDRLYELLEQYKSEDKWFDKNGLFMVNEWNKLIADVTRFKDESFSFPWAMDNRGRMYDRGSYISVQGDKFQKAMLELNGKKVVKLDAKNQSLGIYALLGADDVSAPRLGLTEHKLEDIRVELANRLNTYIGVDGVFVKDTVKHLVMVFFYGGMEKQLMDNLDTIKDDARYAGKKTIRDLFPKDKEAGAYQLVLDTLTELAPGAVKLMNLIYAFNDETKSRYEWTMPDGFKVDVEATDTVTYKGFYVDLQSVDTISVSIKAKVPFNTRFNRSLAPNVIHSIDAYIGREVIRRCDFDIMFIHDSFGVEEENVGMLIQVYKEVLCDVLEMGLLESILGQINPNIRFRITKGGLTKDMVMAGMPLSIE